MRNVALRVPPLLSRHSSKSFGCRFFNRSNHKGLWLMTKTQWRGAKSRATLQINELSQRPFTPENNLPEIEDEGPAYPTVVQQARNNMRKYENCVLLTRVGSFYEVCSIHRKGEVADPVSSCISNMRTNMDHSLISRWPRRKRLLAQCPW